MTDNIKKKRGRKPKNLQVSSLEVKISVEETKSDDENIILHLPITMHDINNTSNTIFANNKNDNLTDKFIKKSVKKIEKAPQSLITQTIISAQTLDKITENTFDKLTKKITEKSFENSSDIKNSNYDSMNYININKISIHTINIQKNTKCWWCHHSFNSPPIQLPDDYYNNTFFCNGHYCSFNCAKSYNLNTNDNLVGKRYSLLNLLYYQTYGKYIEIIAAPSWLILEDYGGTLSIDKFRDNFIFNTKEYLVLHPPLISRQMQIEESYKINSAHNVPINNLNKMYTTNDNELQLKRAKPIINSHLNLENTMGLMRIQKK
jgi:hypothetical protein